MILLQTMIDKLKSEFPKVKFTLDKEKQQISIAPIHPDVVVLLSRMTTMNLRYFLQTSRIGMWVVTKMNFPPHKRLNQLQGMLLNSFRTYSTTKLLCGAVIIKAEDTTIKAKNRTPNHGGENNIKSGFGQDQHTKNDH